MRTKSITDFEENLLIELMRRHKDVESKITNRFFNKKKALAWKAITDSFNSHEEVTARTTDQIKRWWDNQKKKIKKQVAERRRAVTKTGGGPEDYFEADHNLVLAEGILQDQLYPMPNANDCDTEYLDRKGPIVEYPDDDSQVKPSDDNSNPTLMLVTSDGSNKREATDSPSTSSSAVCQYTATGPKPNGSTINLTASNRKTFTANLSIPARKPSKKPVNRSKITEAQGSILILAAEDASLKRKLIETQLEGEERRKIIQNKKLELLDLQIEQVKQQMKV